MRAPRLLAAPSFTEYRRARHCLAVAAGTSSQNERGARPERHWATRGETQLSCWRYGSVRLNVRRGSGPSVIADSTAGERSAFLSRAVGLGAVSVVSPILGRYEDTNRARPAAAPRNHSRHRDCARLVEWRSHSKRQLVLRRRYGRRLQPWFLSAVRELIGRNSDARCRPRRSVRVGGVL